MLQKFSFNAFVCKSLQEVEYERLFHLELLKNKVINLAVSRLSAMVTSGWGDKVVTAVLRIIEPLMEIACLSDIEQFTISHEQVDPSAVIGSNGEAAESPRAILVELPVSFVSVQLLRVELQDVAVFVSLRNERLDEAEAVA